MPQHPLHGHRQQLPTDHRRWAIRGPATEGVHSVAIEGRPSASAVR
jgi:hypothetical protein